MIEPLPNANNTGVPTDIAVRRGWLVLKALPQVVPGTTFRESLLGNGRAELSHVENLPQRVPILAGGLADRGGGGRPGRPGPRGLLRLEAGMPLGERMALDFGLGAGCWACWRSWSAGWAGSTPGSAGGPGRPRRGGPVHFAALAARQRQGRCSGGGQGAVFGPFVVAMILAAMLPSIDFDVLEYHLEGPKEYFQSGRISYLPHNVYTNMPFNVEMLHLLAMEVMGDWWWGAFRAGSGRAVRAGGGQS